MNWKKELEKKALNQKTIKGDSMLQIGKVYRAAKSIDPSVEKVDNLPNYYHETYIPNKERQIIIERGIFKPATVIGKDGIERTPLIVISSSPHKAGSNWTPWSDDYDPNHGRVIYYGDNKTPGMNPLDKKLNNPILLNLLDVYRSSSSEERLNYGVPCIFFERVKVGNRIKGNLMFQGFGIVEKAERVIQNTNDNEKFINYKFTFCVFSLKHEHDNFDWQWIIDRCNPSLTAEEANRNAPESWKTWIKYGSTYLSKVRRNNASQIILNPYDQILPPNSEEYELLSDIYQYYSTYAKDDFGWLGIDVTRRVLEKNGIECSDIGRVSHHANSRRSEFNMHLNIGDQPLTGIDLRILGQADCTDPAQQAGDYDISKETDSLKSGLIGSFVTTSYFSQETQKKIQEYRSPIMLINGKIIAQTVREQLYETNMPLDRYLTSIVGKNC